MKLKDVQHKENDRSSEFLDPKNEFRRLFAECWGTFLLVLAGAGAVVVAEFSGDISKGMEVVAPGLMSVPHVSHERASGVPHSKQNLPSVRFSAPQLGQIMRGLRSVRSTHSPAVPARAGGPHHSAVGPTPSSLCSLTMRRWEFRCGF